MAKSQIGSNIGFSKTGKTIVATEMGNSKMGMETKGDMDVGGKTLKAWARNLTW